MNCTNRALEGARAQRNQYDSYQMREGERLKGYNTLLWRIRTIGLKAIIEGCESDLALLKKLANLEKSS